MSTSRLVGALTLITKVRGVLTDIDGYDVLPTPIPKVKLVISVVEPSSLAGVVYTSSSGYPTVSSTTDDVAKRVAKGVYTFYDIELAEKVISDSTKWDEQDTPAGVLRKGYVYNLQFCYTIDGQNYVETKEYLHDEEGRHLAPVQHAYTFLQLKTVASKFLGDNPGSATVSEVVNDALMEVWAAYEWSFRKADSIAIDAVAGQPYLILPTDFLKLETIERTGDQNHRMVQVSPKEMRQLREQGLVTTTNQTYYYVNHNPPMTTDEPTHAVIEVYPTFSVSVANAYTIDYERSCPGLSADADVPSFPTGMAPLLKQAVRCVAAEQEEDESADRERARFENMLLRWARMDVGRISEQHLGPINRRYANDELPYLNPLNFIDPDQMPADS